MCSSYVSPAFHLVSLMQHCFLVVSHFPHRPHMSRRSLFCPPGCCFFGISCRLTHAHYINPISTCTVQSLLHLPPFTSLSHSFTTRRPVQCVRGIPTCGTIAVPDWSGI